MAISDRFVSKYITAADVTEKGVNVVIDYVAVEEVGKEKEEKLVIHFLNDVDTVCPFGEKSMTLNKTNALALAELLGDEESEWGGKEIRLFQGWTMMDGRRTRCILAGAPIAIAKPKAAK